MKEKIISVFKITNNFTNSKTIAPFLCIISGVMGAVPYYCEGLFILTFVSLYLLFYILNKQRTLYKRVFLPFFCYFIGFYTPLYLFLSELYPYERFGFSEDQAAFIVVCSCILIPLIHALVESLVMYVSKYLPDNHLSVLGYAALWVIGEWILTMGTLAFPWGNIAISMTGFLPYLQTASLFGKYFITFITVLGCGYLALAAFNRKRIFAMLGAGVIIANTLVGTILWFIPVNKSEPVTIAALQGNVLSNEKWDSDKQGSIFERYIDLTEEAGKNGAEIVLLPESAIPISFTEGGFLHTSLAKIAKEYDMTILAGVSCRNSKEGIYNSVVAIYPDGTASERYDKRHLVPFGEFMPFAKTLGELIPFVGEFNESSSDYSEGNKTVVIGTEDGSITPLVCFDSIFPQFAREGCAEGAKMIAIVTNDSWFNDSAGIYTHLRHAQLRAIENSRFVIRAANTGVSAFIDEKGRITKSTEPLTIDTIYTEAYYVESTALYTYIGDFVLYASFIATIILLIINLRRKKNGRHSSASN